MKTYNCLICLDSHYLAININDPSKVVPMIELAGLGLEEYRLSLCSCQKQQNGQMEGGHKWTQNKHMR